MGEKNPTKFKAEQVTEIRSIPEFANGREKICRLIGAKFTDVERLPPRRG